LIYDIIGDIHGYADKLEGLLLKLKYKMKGGYYQQEGHQAIFVGDFIDRGMQNRRVLEIVRNMTDNGSAQAVMGNHEYNATCYHTHKPDTKCDYLRPHTRSKLKQHQNFLKEFPLDCDDTNEVIKWFKTLPLFLDLGDFRVIHACWDDKAIEAIKPYLNPDNTLHGELYPLSANGKAPLFDLIERLLKGVEVELPDNKCFFDKDNNERHHIRVKWWSGRSGTCKELAFGYTDEVSEKFPDVQIEIPEDIHLYKSKIPVFFGHYWQTSSPPTLPQERDNVCCVDYSAGAGGDLVCYQFENPTDSRTLNAERFERYGLK